MVALERWAHFGEIAVAVVDLLDRRPRHTRFMRKDLLGDVDGNAEPRHRAGDVAAEVVERPMGNV